MKVQEDIVVTWTMDEVQRWVDSQLKARGLESDGPIEIVAEKGRDAEVIKVKAKTVPQRTSRTLSKIEEDLKQRGQ